LKSLSGITYYCKVRIHISADIQKVQYQPIVFKRSNSADIYVGLRCERMSFPCSLRLRCYSSDLFLNTLGLNLISESLTLVHGLNCITHTKVLFSNLHSSSPAQPFLTNEKSRDGNSIVIKIASHLFSQKNYIYKSHRNPQKNRICYRISKLNKNNLQLFRFFNKLSTVLYLVVSLRLHNYVSGERKV